MGKDERPDKHNTGPLTGEDAELWRRVAGTAKPLAKRQNRRARAAEPAPRHADDAPPPKQKKAAVIPGAIPQAMKAPAPPKPPPVESYARREVRKLGAGREKIDARIDLHGMRQREAHAALKAFLARERARGHRHVLVITGKGGRRGEEGEGERGVLNREVPRWLAEPDFREMVAGSAPAHRRHGGEGAMYVRLRREKKA